MIKVRAPLEMQPDPAGGWQLVFWVLDAFHHTPPFRAMLTDIAGALGQDAQKDLQLPAYQVNEDFIEGSLQFRSTTLRVYYEHSLSYLILGNHDEVTLREAAEHIRPCIVLIS